jgi:hypothetical protein
MLLTNVKHNYNCNHQSHNINTQTWTCVCMRSYDVRLTVTGRFVGMKYRTCITDKSELLSKFMSAGKRYRWKFYNICLSIYLSMALQPFVGPWPPFQFLNPVHSSVGLLGWGISPPISLCVVCISLLSLLGNGWVKSISTFGARQRLSKRVTAATNTLVL